jgi:soluble lytic murein transglycosylase-like protein
MLESKAFLFFLQATDSPSFAVVCHNSSVTRTVTLCALCALLAVPAISIAAAPAADSGRTALDQADLRQLVQMISREHGVDPMLVDALVRVESSYDPDAVSRRGAMGLMQLMPATVKRLNIDDPFDPEKNIRGGVQEVSRLLDQYSGNLQFALAAYNAGEGAVARYRGVPPFTETQNYVSRILTIYTGQPYRMGGSYRPARPVKMVRHPNGTTLITNTPAAAGESAHSSALDDGPLRGGFGTK